MPEIDSKVKVTFSHLAFCLSRSLSLSSLKHLWFRFRTFGTYRVKKNKFRNLKELILLFFIHKSIFIPFSSQRFINGHFFPQKLPSCKLREKIAWHKFSLKTNSYNHNSQQYYYYRLASLRFLVCSKRNHKWFKLESDKGRRSRKASQMLLLLWINVFRLKRLNWIFEIS